MAAAEEKGLLGDVVSGLGSFFVSGATVKVSWRRRVLSNLNSVLREVEEDVVEAMREDLGRPNQEILLGELGVTYAAIDKLLRKVKSWAEPRGVPHRALTVIPGSSYMQFQPKGVVLIIAPWNYPFNLSLMPMAEALAAGNCVLLKPSEVSVRSAAVLGDIVHRLDSPAVKCVQGGVEETQQLLSHKFDHILFTGSRHVALQVAARAAVHLTPCTLELGGKSPVIVDEKAQFATLGPRLCWGKFFNCGQTCIAADYVLVTEAAADQLKRHVLDTISSWYGSDPKASPDLGRIVNERHWDRVAALLREEHGGEVLCGGLETADRESRFFPPTVVLDPLPGSKLLMEEIFGPILPVVVVRDVAEAVTRVNAGGKPLALYIFSKSRKTVDFVLGATTSGGCCINDTCGQFLNDELPFGGVGESGMGAYHGHHGFETFSHKRAVMHRGTWVDLSSRYPPYVASSTQFLMRLVTGEILPWKATRG